MSNETKEKIWFWIAVAALFAYILLVCNSCTTTKVVEVPQYHETIKAVHDTTIIRDSVSVVQYVHEKDSSWMTIDSLGNVIREHLKIIDRLNHKEHQNENKVIIRDTLIVNDSIRIPYKVEVEKRLSFMQQVYMTTGKYSLWLLLGIVLLVIIILRKKVLS